MLLLKSLGIWFLLAVLAIIIGTIRTFLILPYVGEQAAHIIGTIIFLAIQFIVIFFFIKRITVDATQDLLMIGIFWIILTIIFEFIFGHYVMNHPWEKLFADYNILNGRLWSLVLLNNLAAPLISGKLLRDKKFIKV